MASDLRQAVREWVERTWAPEMPLRDWWAALACDGWAFPHWPAEWFGRGLPGSDARIVRDMLRGLDVPGAPAGLATMMAGPTILRHGSDEQKRRLLPPIACGGELWCQLFSEPDAGSDLPSLRTKARYDGAVWRITGQKVWTSNGHIADRGMLLARTKDGSTGRDGITYFVIDMHQPEIDVRPLREMTGRQLFTEVFLDGAAAEERDIVGALHQGWPVARTTLASERTGLGEAGGVGIVPGQASGWLDRPLAELKGRATRPGARGPSGTAMAMKGAVYEALAAAAAARGALDDATLRGRLARLYCLERTASLYRSLSGSGGFRSAGREAGSVGKLMHSRVVQYARDLAADLLGQDLVAPVPGDALTASLRELYLFSPAVSIYGGTDEIQRNIVAERVLGLPRDDA